MGISDDGCPPLDHTRWQQDFRQAALSHDAFLTRLAGSTGAKTGTFSIQPFIYKAGGAIANGVVGLSAIISGINQNPKVILSGAPLFNFKALMFLLPLVCILIGWVVYKAKFRISEKFYAEIHAALVERGDLVDPIESS